MHLLSNTNLHRNVSKPSYSISQSCPFDWGLPFSALVFNYICEYRQKTYTAKNLLEPLHYCCRRGGSNISYFDIHAQSYGKLLQYNGH